LGRSTSQPPSRSTAGTASVRMDRLRIGFLR
jgi:hypothetical protein